MDLPVKGPLTVPRRIAETGPSEIGRLQDVCGETWGCPGTWETTGSLFRTCGSFKFARKRTSFWFAEQFRGRTEVTSSYDPLRKNRMPTRGNLNECDRTDN